jgi:alpha-glucosidase
MQHFRLFLLLLTVVCTGNSYAKNYSVKSPNGKVVVTVGEGPDLSLSVAYQGKEVVVLPSIGLGTMTSGIRQARTSWVIDECEAPLYRQSRISMKGQQLDVRLKNGFGLQVRAYDEGAAYRFYTTNKGETIVPGETVDFQFAGDPKAWLSYSTNDEKPFAMAFQNTYDETLLSKAADKMIFLPATIEEGDVKVTLLESDLRQYPGMFLKAEGNRLSGHFAPYPKRMDYYKWRGMSYVAETEDYIAKSTGPRTYPWRVIAISEKDTDMPTNDLVYTLAAPNRVGDTSWVKPGKVAWDWWNDWNLKGVDFKAGINTRTYLYYIDFAAKYGLEYVVLDEGWYDSSKGDLMHPIADIDLQRLIDYGREKGVGIVLWTVFNVLDEHLDEACQKYAALGAKGFKVDFLDRNDQTAVEMAERLAATCAKHKMMLDYHGFFTPTGMNRTYPNIVNYESVFGMEECRWAKKTTDMPRYDVTFPFIRMMAGQVDFTPGAMRNGTKENWVECYQNPVSMGTRCHQAACYVVHDSPFTMLCDAPTNYETEPEYTKFIAQIFNEWEETRVLQGEIGKYIVTARRIGNTWYVGGQTNWDERTITLPLSFLNKEQHYVVTLLTDGINANHNAEDYQLTYQTCLSHETLNLKMASGGGFVLKFEYE